MELERKKYLEFKTKDIGHLMYLMKEVSLQMDYHFKFDDEEFWQALDESIDISAIIENKSEFERIEYFKTTKHLRNSVQEIELYEDLEELNAHLAYFRHCFLRDVPREKLR